MRTGLVGNGCAAASSGAHSSAPSKSFLKFIASSSIVFLHRDAEAADRGIPRIEQLGSRELAVDHRERVLEEALSGGLHGFVLLENPRDVEVDVVRHHVE